MRTQHAQRQGVSVSMPTNEHCLRQCRRPWGRLRRRRQCNNYVMQTSCQHIVLLPQTRMLTTIQWHVVLTNRHSCTSRIRRCSAYRVERVISSSMSFSSGCNALLPCVPSSLYGTWLCAPRATDMQAGHRHEGWI